MSLVQHAEQELRRAGLFDKDADYGGDTGKAVLELMIVFAAQGHSGASAGLTIDLFRRLASYETLTPVGNPAKTGEYIEHGDDSWQSTRDPSVFSDDRGRTWYHLDKHRTRWQRALAWVRANVGLPIPFRYIRGRVC